jgi:site-specific DNA-adenine methylase
MANPATGPISPSSHLLVILNPYLYAVAPSGATFRYHACCEFKMVKSPFPYPGGKAKVADVVWDRLGNVDNYAEPFMGSAAVLLRRPQWHFDSGYRVETANDKSHFIVNFWRSVREDPESVAKHADWPVTEADLHARHKWLTQSEHAEEWREKMKTDPEAFDAKVAGWWGWGACCWIGSGWCEDKGRGSSQIPDFDGGRGENAAPTGRPQLCDAFDIGRGVNSNGQLSVQVPHISNAGQGVNALPGGGVCEVRREWLVAWMKSLSDRLRLVRTCYGHWSRICDSDSTLTRLGLTGVFLDPPYPIKSTNGKKSRADGLYANDKEQDLNKLRDEVLTWCLKWGGDSQIRVGVCGYEGDGYEALLPSGWTEFEWEASGGYGNQNKTKKGKSDNAKRERIFFSPHCLNPNKPSSLFD